MGEPTTVADADFEIGVSAPRSSSGRTVGEPSLAPDLEPAGPPHRPTRVAIVGVGLVGSTFAYALLLSGLAAEIVLIDVNHERAEGEAMDLNHSVPFAHPTKVWAGDYEDCDGAAVTVIAAGVNQKPGETRLELVRRNAAIFGQIVPPIARANPNGIIVVATNPVDVLTHITLGLSGLPARRVFGSGTILDTARFRYLLSEHLGVDPRSVHAYIIGEHGDSEVPVWSLANVAGMRLPTFCVENGIAFSPDAMDRIFRETRDAAYEIISRKGATYYAVAAGLMRIVEAILRDQRTVLSISSLIEDYYGVDGVCLSLPTVVSRRGIERVLRLGLSPGEARGVRRSAEVLRATIASLAEGPARAREPSGPEPAGEAQPTGEPTAAGEPAAATATRGAAGGDAAGGDAAGGDAAGGDAAGSGEPEG